MTYAISQNVKNKDFTKKEKKFYITILAHYTPIINVKKGYISF